MYNDYLWNLIIYLQSDDIAKMHSEITSFLKNKMQTFIDNCDQIETNYLQVGRANVHALTYMQDLRYKFMHETKQTIFYEAFLSKFLLSKSQFLLLCLLIFVVSNFIKQILGPIEKFEIQIYN